MSIPFVYADPAWQFETWSEEGKDRSPEEHYDCMPLDEIKALPVRDIVADDSACGLWVIDTMIPQGIEVLNAWGFDYKTVLFYYVKVGRALRPHMGMGYWTRANPEICLFGTRGKPKRNGKGVERLILDLDPNDRTILAPRGEHSEKPLEAYSRIESARGDMQYYVVAGPGENAHRVKIRTEGIVIQTASRNRPVTS